MKNMLDLLLKNKFYRKCKAAMKVTKKRIEIVKRKRNATQKYLKNDVADLVKDGLDINAYGRAEGLFIELNLTSCYDLVDRFCDYVLENLSVISKQRECPEECREAVGSLIFSAAGFADLPELRELRSIFRERYGTNLDCYLSTELVEKLKLTHPGKDATLELMQDIATEASVHWDSKATEQKLYNQPPAFRQGRTDVIDKIQASLGYISNHPKQKNYLKVIQEDITVRKEQETEPETTRHVPPIPRYNRNKGEGKLRVDSRNDCVAIGISEVGSSTTSRKNRHEVKKKTRVHEDQPDEEERWLDRLLMHYSRKSYNPYFRTGNTKSTKSLPKEDVYYSRPKRGASWDNRVPRAALSVKAEQKVESEGTNRQHFRSTSLQPEMLRGGHVHPKLPDDYDEFLAHLAAIRDGRKWKNTAS